MENNWIENVTGTCPVAQGTIVDVKYRDGEIKEKLPALEWSQGRDATDAFWWNDDSDNDIVSWRFHKPEQSLDDALGDKEHYHGERPVFEYPQTTFKPSSEEQLRSDEAVRVNSLLSEKLRTIADIASKLTRKNFSVADIKLVKDLLESVEEYEENK